MPAVGAVILVTTVDGMLVGSCVAEVVEDGANIASCSVPVPPGIALLVSEDVSTLPAGYAPTNNPQTAGAPPERPAGIVGGPVFLNLPEGGGAADSPASGTTTDEAAARTLTIYKAECPTGYEGDASADECDANPVPGVPFRVGRPFSEAFSDFAPSNGEGLVSFGFNGLPREGTLRVIEELPAGTERFVAFCVDSAGVPLGIIYPADVGNPKLGVADVAVGEAGDVACDWYNVPEAPQPGAQTDANPADGIVTIAPLDEPPGASRPAENQPVAIYAGTCGDLDAGPRFELSPLVAKLGEPEGPTAATAAVASLTSIDASITNLLADDHAVVIQAPGDAERTEGNASLVACGEIGGVRDEAGSLAVGLREQNGSGVEGIAYLVPDPDVPGRARVSVFTAERLAEED